MLKPLSSEKKGVYNFKNQYYEGVIQLRPSDPEVIHFIENQIRKRKGVVFISKVVKQKTGVDLYISSQRFARNLGEKLKKSFKGELKITSTIFSKNRITSREIFRATVLFRLAPKENKEDSSENI